VSVRAACLILGVWFWTRAAAAAPLPPASVDLRLRATPSPLVMPVGSVRVLRLEDPASGRQENTITSFLENAERLSFVSQPNRLRILPMFGYGFGVVVGMDVP
jgi:hypothetical protein